MIAAALALAFTAGCVGCLAYLQLAPTGYSPIRNAVSEYGVGAYAGWYRAQASCLGLAAICLAVALGGPRRVVVLLALFAAARIAIGWFPTNRFGEPPTWRGSVHLLLAAVAFAAVPWAAVALPAARHGAPQLGRAMAALAVLTAVSLRSGLRPWFGFVERGFYVATLAWVTLVAARLV